MVRNVQKMPQESTEEIASDRYLLARARELGLHTILKKYQPLG